MDGARLKAKPRIGAATDAATLAKQLRLIARARADGAREHPASDAAQWSEAEDEVAAALAGERARIEEARAALRTDAERRLRALAPHSADFAAPARDASLAMRQIETRLAHDLTEASSRARAARGDVAAFKEAHDIRRQAVYPDSTLLQAGLLFCAALFESLFSASLFAETDERGLLGGAVIAIGLSGANVALGFLSGYIGLRYMQHARWPYKTAGALAFAAFAALAAMLNLFAADWRDALASPAETPPDQGSDATFHFWSLLQLSTPQAIILLMLGAGVWVFAALKGYSGFDDPYPDFGKMDRAARAASDELAEQRATALAALEQPIEDARAAISAGLAKQRAEMDAMSAAFDDAAVKSQALDDEAAKLDAIGLAALTIYREENRAARTSPAPAYFNQRPPWQGAHADALEGAAAQIEQARAHIAASQAAAASALDALVKDLEAASERLGASA